jgi:hypothetical protein
MSASMSIFRRRPSSIVAVTFLLASLGMILHGLGASKRGNADAEDALSLSEDRLKFARLYHEAAASGWDNGTIRLSELLLASRELCDAEIAAGQTHQEQVRAGVRYAKRNQRIRRSVRARLITSVGGNEVHSLDLANLHAVKAKLLLLRVQADDQNANSRSMPDSSRPSLERSEN